MNILYNSIVYYTVFNVTYYMSSYIVYLWDYNEICENENIIKNNVIVDEIEMEMEMKMDMGNDINENKNSLTITKCQQTSLKELMDTYNKITKTVMLNTFVYSLPIILIAGYYDTTFELVSFSFIKCMCDLFFALLCIDPFFYIMHRLFHIKPLYKIFHKKHHEITKPVGMAALYTTWGEFYLGNILPIFLPLFIVGAHPFTVKIWIMIVIINTIFLAHSGYKKLADFHDKHHQFFTKNYGTDIFMDKIMGTYM